MSPYNYVWTVGAVSCWTRIESNVECCWQDGLTLENRKKSRSVEWEVKGWSSVGDNSDDKTESALDSTVNGNKKMENTILSYTTILLFIA